MTCPSLYFILLNLNLFSISFPLKQEDDTFVDIAKRRNSTGSGNSKISSLTKFLQEPQLGTSWYSPGGPRPTFMGDQSNGTVYRSRLGDDGLLSCRVSALELNLVSWFKLDEFSRLPVLLTVGFQPHLADDRFLLDLRPPNDYRLRVRDVRWSDRGRYLCQLSTHPPEILWSRLEILRPRVRLRADNFHYDSGSTVELLCAVQRPPLYRVSIQWEARLASDPRNAVHILNEDIRRGGVKIDTGRDKVTGQLHSKLLLHKATDADSGNYTCKLMSYPEDVSDRRGLSDTRTVHVLKAQNTEAIQSSGQSGLRSSLLFVFIISAKIYHVLKVEG